MERSVKLMVVGTDTDVGKTVFSLLLMQYFYLKGETPFYLKLVQTGCRDARDRDSDARFIYEHVEALKGKDPSDSTLYCFKNPKAPYFAARNEGKVVDVAFMQESVIRKASSYTVLVMETAGGLLVPVDEKFLNVDLIGLMGAAPILVARAGLGTINHTLLTLEVLRTRKIEPLGVVLLDSGKDGTDREMIDENMECIEKVSGIRVGGIIGNVGDFSRPDRDCYHPIERMMEVFGII